MVNGWEGCDPGVTSNSWAVFIVRCSLILSLENHCSLAGPAGTVWWRCWCCWSLLCSTILRFWADSLRLHVILHEWIAFYSTFLNIHQSGVLAVSNSAGIAGATWNSCHLDAFCVHHTTMHHVTSCKATCVFSCNLPPALLAEWPGSFMCYCGNTEVERISEMRISTESRSWRRKFSRLSCRDSNPRPFDHESGALTTELSPPPVLFGM